MLHLEGFFNFSRKDKNTSWIKIFNLIKSEYDKLKNKKPNELISIPGYKLPDAEIIERGDFSLSLGIRNHILFRKSKEQYEVINFNEVKSLKSDSNEGVYKIEKSDFEKYKKLAEEISNWRDEISEKNFQKTDKTIDNLEFDELDIESQNLNFELNNIFKTKFSKEYEFEFNYRLWTSVSSNEEVDERRKIKFNKIEIEILSSRAVAKLFTKIDNRDWYLWIEEDTNSGYIDLSKLKPWEKELNMFIKVDKIKKEKTRKQEREESQNIEYPYIINYEIVCSSWDSTELINEIKSILEELNKSFKK
jgi:hypothetical protein